MMTKRWVVRIGSLMMALAVVSLMALHAPRPAAAQGGWCADDPVVSIGGYRVQIVEYVQGDPRYVDAMVNVANVKIFIPRGVPTQLLSVTQVYFHEKVEFIEMATLGPMPPWKPGQDIPVTVQVTFDARAKLPAMMTVNYPGGTVTKSGDTKGQMVATFKIKP